MKFGKAVNLVKQIQEQIALHGNDLEVAFYVGEQTVANANDSVIGAIKIDGVEKTEMPRLDLAFSDKQNGRIKG